MATSGSYNFTVTRNDIITEAFEVLGKVPDEEPLTSAEIASASRSLNLLCKQLHVEQGLRLWKVRDATVFFDTTKNTYSLSSTGNNATLSYNNTTTTAAAISGATAITVTSTTGFVAGYFVGIQLDTGNLQWTTVSSVAGSTINLGAALTGAVASGNFVFVYQTKLVRPLRVVAARYKNQQTTETPINVISQQEYENLPNKTDGGMVNLVYYRPELTDGKLFLWNQPNDVQSTLTLTCYLPLEDFDSASDEPDFPIEWAQAICYGLAHKLSFKYGVTSKTRDDIKFEYLENIEKVKSFDKEITPIYFNPYGELGYGW